MRFINATETSISSFVMVLLLFFVSSAVAQDNGEADLDKAFDLKIKAKSLRDLESVVKLCKSSIKKGLDEDDVEQANQLASTTLYEHAEQLTREIFKTQGKNTRFKFYRREAMKRLNEAIEFDPKLGSAYSMMAQLNVLPGGDPDLARENIDKAIELSAGEPEELSQALLTRARLAAITDPTAALADVNQAVKIDESNKDARILRAEYNFRSNKITKAIEDLDVILAGSDFNGYFKQAQNLRIQANGLTASARIEDEEERTNAVAEIRETAIRYLDKAIELDGQKREAYDLKASVLVDSEDWDEAIAAVDKSLELDEKNIGTIRLRSSILASQKKMDEAIEEANRAYDLDPESLETLLFRNQLHESNNDLESAIKDAKLMVELRPEADGLQRNLARAYVINDQPTKAIKVYDDLLDRVYRKNAWKNQPPQQGFMFALARMETLGSRANSFLSKGDHEKAIKDYEESIETFGVLKDIQEEAPGIEKMLGVELDESHYGILNNFAWVLATSPNDDVRDGQRAVDLATKACELSDYEKPHILSTLASAYAEEGDFDEAKKWIEKGLEVNESLLAEDGSNEEDIKSQADSLNDELASYEDEKPWREKEDVEGEKKAEGKDDEKDGDDADEDDDEKSDDEDEDDKDEKSDDEDEDDDDKDDDDKESDK